MVQVADNALLCVATGAGLSSEDQGYRGILMAA